MNKSILFIPVALLLDLSLAMANDKPEVVGNNSIPTTEQSAKNNTSSVDISKVDALSVDVKPSDEAVTAKIETNQKESHDQAKNEVMQFPGDAVFRLVDNPGQPLSQGMNWIGVMLSPVPTALRDQLNQIIPMGQGVLVSNVSTASPAAMAGIQRNDVLLEYDDQRLYSPRQLAGLIQADKVGREVNFKVVQNGQLKNISLKLGTHNVMVPPGYFLNMPPLPAIPAVPKVIPKDGGSSITGSDANNTGLVWDSFESLEVKTLEDGRYHAEISYKDEDNKSKNFTFEGKRNEIEEQIKAQKELPEAKKQALLNALNGNPQKAFSQPFNQPMFNGNPFNHPFFQRDPLNDPMFNRNFFEDPFFNRQLPNQPQTPQKVPQMNEKPEKII